LRKLDKCILLWKEREVCLAGTNLKGVGQRKIRGMPHAVIEARGPGRIAVTGDASGEAVVLPLQPGHDVDVRGHAFLAASRNVSYDFIRLRWRHRWSVPMQVGGARCSLTCGKTLSCRGLSGLRGHR
jgi:uncharacterized protein (AIM24 family)